MENSQIENSFDFTLQNSNLQSITFDVAEIGIDSILKDGLLKEIPIVGTITNLIKFGVNMHDRLFLEKVISYLFKLKDVSPKDRKKIIEDIDSSKEYRIKFGKKALYILDSCNDYENAELIGLLSKSLFEGKISYDDYLRCANVIQAITMYDFKWFLEKARDYMSAEDVRGLVGTGLFDLSYQPIEVDINEIDDKDYGGSNPYKADVDGGGIDVTLSRVGNIIMDLFGNKEKKKVIRL